MQSLRATFKKCYLLCFSRYYSLLANSKIKTKYTKSLLSCWPLCEKTNKQKNKTKKRLDWSHLWSYPVVTKGLRGFKVTSMNKPMGHSIPCRFSCF